ncbi:TetR/AcrR family transcriptional regulator [Micromonospora sp. CPCC 205561]|uniref:TetR/AcrR family transcriptional regulator n=1 Tax=Micromonospora sp. CPCC 205561 TaxID=3122407 RepID=UPI002FF31CEC
MARPRRQDAQRAHLMAAAQRAIKHRGLANVRVRDIADAANTSPGTVTYYWRDVRDLFQDVYEHAIERFHQRRQQASNELREPVARLLAMIESGLPTDHDDGLCCLLYEFSPQARLRAGDAHLRRTLFDQQVDLYEHILNDGAARGVFTVRGPIRRVACNLVALEDAYGYHIVTGTSIDRAGALTLIINYAETATGADLTTAHAALSAEDAEKPKSDGSAATGSLTSPTPRA